MRKRSDLFVRRFGVAALRLGLILVLGSGGFVASVITTSTAKAQSELENSAEADKAYWQDRYRTLRDEAARLRKTGEVARARYAAANRRNYRRGTNRREQREIAIEAETELARVEAELAALPEQARVSGALPGWLREVEDEPAITVEAPPASAMEDVDELADDDEFEDDDGPNPLYPDE